MKSYGIKKKDNDCCYGHAKYGVRGFTMKGIKRPRKFSKDKPRKAKMRHLKIEIE